jgi:glycosyltransferase involved in cell wall biosynthesis
MPPLVSVVIPTYNTAKYISYTLDSVFQQTFKDYEVIVVDDGSTDNTKAVLKPYMQKVSYIYQENSGRSEGRNTGIKAASGKYIAFLDSDDLWTPTKVEEQVALMEKHQEIDFLFGDKQRFSDDGTILIQSMFLEKGYDKEFFGHELYVKDPYKKLLEEPYIPTGTVIMKTECFDEIGFFDKDIYAEDWEFWLRVALFKTLAYADELWELERDRPGSGSKNLKAVYLSRIHTLEKHEREYQAHLNDLAVDLNKEIHKAYLNVGYFFLKSQKTMARQFFVKALSRKIGPKPILYWAQTFLP